MPQKQLITGIVRVKYVIVHYVVLQPISLETVIDGCTIPLTPGKQLRTRCLSLMLTEVASYISIAILIYYKVSLLAVEPFTFA